MLDDPKATTQSLVVTTLEPGRMVLRSVRPGTPAAQPVTTREVALGTVAPMTTLEVAALPEPRKLPTVTAVAHASTRCDRGEQQGASGSS